MEQAIRAKDYYIRDCDIELTLKNVDILLRERTQVFLQGSGAGGEDTQKLYQEYLEYYNLKIKELLKL